MTESETWQQVLQQEQQAVYGYGLVGGQLGPSNVLAHQSIAVHRDRVQESQAVLRGLGTEPKPGPVAFTPRVPITNDTRARELAAQLERGCAAAYSALTAESAPASRRRGTQWLRDSAIRQFHWSGQLPTLPGLNP